MVRQTTIGEKIMSHWYNKNGQLHDTDLKTARKEGYVPSVTEIIHEFSNSYGLDLYKAKQMFLASLTLPRPEGITDDEYFELVKKDSEEHSEKAKQFGIGIHHVINALLDGRTFSDNFINQDILKKAQEVYAWIKQNKDSVIVDFKTQETKEGKFKQPYDSWLFQLCGYKQNDWHMKAGEYIEYEFYHPDGFGGKIDYARLFGGLRDKTKLINIMISSTEDIPIKVYEWKPDKIEWGCKVFSKMVELYRTIKRL